MDYYNLLDKMAQEANLTYAEITRMCENSTNISENYLYSYKNRQQIPDETISRAIARACGRHEEILVLQGIYDKLPIELKRLFDLIIKIAKVVTLTLLPSRADKEAVEFVQGRLDNFYFAEWLEEDFTKIEKDCDFLLEYNKGDIGDSIMEMEYDENEIFPCYTVRDDSMIPNIPAGAKVYPELVTFGNLKNGDYVCWHNKDEVNIRKIEFVGEDNNTIFLKPLHDGGGTFKTELIDTRKQRLYEKIVHMEVDFK